jgi:serine/threonine protein kinase
MTPELWQQVKLLYDQASLLGDDERRSLLEAACEPGSEVRIEVEALLAAPEPHADFLESPGLAGALGTLEQRIADAYIGQRLGPYEITGRIASGGTSTVYEAWRRDGHYKQRVAVKVVRPGMDYGFILGRLHAERQILAGLSHPNIASLLDGGATPSGAPYLVMEFIDGLPITEYCDQQQLTITQRLALFQDVCAAVQHAHRNLVVHRDIKPGNVLVTNDGIPKLLDFGIAKLLHDSSELPQEATRTVRMLTPEYASPEQLLGEPITTSTDVYSLGALLYELLTGRRPHRTSHDSPLEMARAVCETEPEKPSSLVTRRNPEQQPEALAAARAIEPKRLRRTLAGDLDNIEKQDPSNMRFRSGVLSTCNYLGEILREQGDWKQAIAYHQRAVAGAEAQLKADPKNAAHEIQLAWRNVGLGDDYAAGARWQQAVASYRKATAAVAGLQSRNALTDTELQTKATRQLAAAEAKLTGSR